MGKEIHKEDQDADESAENVKQQLESKKQSLRKLKKQIRKLQFERNKQIRQAMCQTIQRYIPINQEASLIVCGGQITGQPTDEQQCESGPVKDLDGSEKLHHYWKKVLMGSEYGQLLNKQDEQVLEHLEVLEVIEFSMQRSSIQFTIGEGHPHIQPGKFVRTIYRDTQGQPISFEGCVVLGYQKLRKGFFRLLFEDNRKEEELAVINQFYQCASSELIPFSLEYYMKSHAAKEEQQRDQAEEVQPQPQPQPQGEGEGEGEGVEVEVEGEEQMNHQ